MQLVPSSAEGGCCTDLVPPKGTNIGTGVVPTKRRRRPTKVKNGSIACVLPVEPGEGVVKGHCPIEKSPRPRGRPWKEKHVAAELEFGPSPSSSPSLGEEDPCNQLVVFEPQRPMRPPSAMTRARAARILGKQLGLSYDCSDEEALQGIVAQIRARGMWPS